MYVYINSVVGGFGLCGIPMATIQALQKTGIKGNITLYAVCCCLAH
jgi:acyl CoA:acetate/3-ketoacid CoA transferase alpha subunit